MNPINTNNIDKLVDFDINKFVVPKPKTKDLLSIIKLVKNVLDECDLKIKEIFKDGFEFNIDGSIAKLIDLILSDFDEDNNEYGRIGSKFMNILQRITKLDDEVFEDIDLLQPIIMKVIEKFKEVNAINFIITKVMTSQNMTKELNSIELEEINQTIDIPA